MKISNTVSKSSSPTLRTALIRKLATVPAKREAFQKLAIDYRRMALELEAIIINDVIQDDHEK